MTEDDAVPVSSQQGDGQPGRSPERAKAELEAEDTAPAKFRPLASKPLIASARAAYGLAFVSGFLYFVAFPGIDVWPLGFVALVPLIVALRGQTPRRAAGLGWLAGFTMTMFGFYWLLDMLKTFSGFPIALCLLFMAILCGYQAGRIALMGWLYGRAENRGWPPALVFVMAFAASELVFPLLFPWTYAATVHQIPVLLQLAEVGGQLLVAVVMVCANLAIAEPILARLEQRPPNWKKAGGLLAVLGLALLYGAIRIPMVDATVAAAPKAQVGIVQANMSLLGKRRDPGEGLRRHLDLTQKLKDQGPLDLVVWAETSVMGAANENFASRIYAARFARALGVPAIFGAVLVRDVQDEREYVLFNSALISDHNGEVKGRYDKQYLLAFGEYLPFGDWFPIMYKWSPHSGRFTPGNTLKPLPYGDRQIAVFICYEDILGGFVNSIVNSGEPELLVNITNDAWFGNTTEPWIHLALAKFRAIEHRRFLVRSVNSGISAFIDPVGRVVSHTDPFEQQAIAHEVAWLKPTTIYQRLGNWPWWLVSLGIFVMAFRVRRPAPTG